VPYETHQFPADLADVDLTRESLGLRLELGECGKERSNVMAVGQLLAGRRADVVLAERSGPANWLVLDAFRALTHRTAEGAVHHIEANAAHAQALGDDATAWRCRDLLPSALRTARRFDESVRVAEELMAHYLKVGRPASRLQVLGQLITTRFARGEFERALDELTDGLVALSRLRDVSWDTAGALVVMSNAASSAEMFELAAGQLRRGVAIARTVGDPFLSRLLDSNTARNEIRWGARLEMIGRPEEAAARYREALRAGIRAQGGEPTGHCARTGRLFEGYAWVALGEPELGRVAMLEGLIAVATSADTEDAIILQLGLTRACAALGLATEGRAHLQRASLMHDTTFSHQWQISLALQACELERVEHGDHPSLPWAAQAAVQLATAVWEERERRLESVMVRTQMLELAEENDRVSQEATQDPLTGLGNRRRLDAALLELTVDAPIPSCLLFIDLDNFKNVNDRFSHAIGDGVLKAVADILRFESRDSDLAARYGGDEFVVLLRGTPLSAAVRVAERIRAAVSARPWGRISPGLHAEVSIGIAEHHAGMTYEDVMGAADAALHAAKDLGRDRVAVA
jgi:diguanylate cyclase